MTNNIRNKEVVWREVPGYEAYEVSEYGDVRNIKTGLVLKPKKSKIGKYLVVSLYKDRKRREIKVHRIVLMAFVGECPTNMIGCHYDGDRYNNHITNLRWATYQDNADDQIRLGRQPRGGWHGKSKLTEEQVREIRKKYRGGVGLDERTLGEEYGVHKATILQIVNNETWRHLL